MKMKKTLLLLGASVMVLPGVMQAQAQEVEISGNVAISTDYVWRGISQSNGDWAVSGGFDVGAGGFYGGVWASNVDFEDGIDDTNIEMDFYGGYAGEFEGGLTFDVGVIYYSYPDNETGDLDFVEVYGGLGYAFENGLELSGMVAFDPDNENLYIEGGAGFALTENFSVSATVGNYSFDAGDDYTWYGFGGTYSVAGVDLGLTFSATDIDDVEIADDRVVFSISKSL